ncbi:hypothetical protein GQR58_012485 [Nymphon striatum]|nr:hypothetical protein GQR58_012485 [Nymphon striatum]
MSARSIYLISNGHEFYILFIAQPTGVNMITLGKLTVPAMVVAGQQFDIDCKFDMKGMKLYALRWYKDNQEFYRYIPKQLPQTKKAFNNQSMGINVDIDESDEGHVYFKNSSVKSGGTYKCQVVSERPFFRIKSATAEMKVLVLPKSRPKIKGRKKRYKIGDIVNLDCISSPSHPAASLYWTINGKKVWLTYVIQLSV